MVSILVLSLSSLPKNSSEETFLIHLWLTGLITEEKRRSLENSFRCITHEKDDTHDTRADQGG